MLTEQIRIVVLTKVTTAYRRLTSPIIPSADPKLSVADAGYGTTYFSGLSPIWDDPIGSFGNVATGKLRLTAIQKCVGALRQSI